jgi:uroporphyrin-III C-methyltransferase/precorrin-2 dehydrogenase/sirohydrochlorin ferrochelatase
VLIGTVKSLPEIVCASEVHAPTLTIIGEVIELHEKLEWFQPREHIPDSEDFASLSEDQARRART